jgi:hypothetical protein
LESEAKFDETILNKENFNSSSFISNAFILTNKLLACKFWLFKDAQTELRSRPNRPSLRVQIRQDPLLALTIALIVPFLGEYVCSLLHLLGNFALPLGFDGLHVVRQD